MGDYFGVTHAVPMWALPLWRRIFCRKNMHVFDEVVSSGDEHYLVCDACELVIEIKTIDTQYMTCPDFRAREE